MSHALVFIDRGTADWDRVWALLAASTGGDTTQPCPCCRERWQYMGSYSDGARTAHEFRHRHHPLTRSRDYRRFTEDTPLPAPEPAGATHELRPVYELLSPEARALVRLVTTRTDTKEN